MCETGHPQPGPSPRTILLASTKAPQRTDSPRGVLGSSLESSGPASPERISAALGVGPAPPSRWSALLLFHMLSKTPSYLVSREQKQPSFTSSWSSVSPKQRAQMFSEMRKTIQRLKGGNVSKEAMQQAGCIMSANVVVLGKTHPS